MKLRAWLLLGLAAACSQGRSPAAAPTEPPSETPIEAIANFDGELGAAKERRRVVALASPT